MQDRIYPFDARPEGCGTKLNDHTGNIIKMLQHANCNCRHTEIYDWEKHAWVAGGNLDEYEKARQISSEEHTKMFRDYNHLRPLHWKLFYKFLYAYDDFKNR